MIIINARFLTQPITGVQRVGIEWSKRLKKLRNDIVFVSPNNILHHELAEELEVEVIGRFKGHVWEQIDLYKYVISKGGPLLMSFGFTGPVFYNNQIVTIHDLGFKIYPERESFKFRLLYNILVPILIRKAKKILTVSEFSKKQICEIFEVDKNKIKCIYNGLSELFIENYNKPNKTQQYVLTVSSHHPRKNFNRLIEAFNNLNLPEVKLFVIGDFVSHFNNETNLNSNKNIIFLNNIDDNTLLEYYRNASLFVFPSLYEGFGIPGIESISQCVPTIVSDIPVFREIYGNMVDYFDPYNISSISSCIEENINKNISIEVLIEYKSRVEAKYSWDKGAEFMNKFINNV